MEVYSHEAVLEAVCEHFSVTIDQLRSRSRKGILSRARQYACYMLDLYCEGTLRVKGSYVGLKHAAFYSSSKTMKGHVRNYKAYRTDVYAINQILRQQVND